MTFTPDHIRNLLSELNDALTLDEAEPVSWLVCGGTALALQGLGTRSTRDVDVLGTWPANGIEVVAIADFPVAVKRAIRRVAAAHPELQGAGPLWVNLGPRQIVEFGLPEGFAKRLTALRVGDKLTLHLLGRPDLIALKLFAAADDMGARQSIHFDDLHALDPTAQEIESSIQWVERLPDPQHRIRPSLKSIVEQLGHEDLAHYIIL